MQIQRIGAYANNYPSNKTQQSNVSNPNFGRSGMHFGKGNLGDVLGPENVDKFIDFTKAWIMGQHSIFFPKVKFDHEFKLVFFRDEEGLKALVGSVGNENCKGIGKLTEGDDMVEAAKTAVKEAVGGWLSLLQKEQTSKGSGSLRMLA